MKILQLCHRVPFPANDGGNIAMISLSDSFLSQGVGLKMLALNTIKHRVDLNSLNKEIIKKYQLEAVPIDTSIFIKDAFLNLFSASSYNVKRFYSPSFEKKLIEVLKAEAPDIVLMESLFMTPYISTIRKNLQTKIILRAHNVEYIIWKRLASNERNFAKRLYLFHLAKRLKGYESDTINKVDAILPITVDDEKIFREMGCRIPMKVTPVGIDAANYSDQINQDDQLSLFHLGAMDWRPNLEGIEWFLDHCWELISTKFPSLQLFLAGRGFPSSLMGRGGLNIHCEGEITDAKVFMSDKQILLVPLKSGGGMRVKIIQGMALGKTIISTTIGAEGISYTNGKNILIADTPKEILAQVERCLSDKNFCYSIGRNAREFVLANYSNEIIGKNVLDFLKNI